MLSDNEISNAIGRDELRLTYSFLPGQDGLYARYHAGARVGRENVATGFLADHTIRSRIALTLGPLIKPVSHGMKVPERYRFSGHREIVDLRKCTNGWALMPAQSAVVFTNEHIRLAPDLAALIVGRVSSYNNGLVTASSFLDSGWEGLIKLHLINTSRKPVRLQLGMEIGRLFLFRTADASSDTSTVSQQGIHYGLTWARVLDDEIDPFPQSPAPPGVRIQAGLSRANELLQKYAGVGLVALVIALGVGAFRVYGEVSSALEMREDVGAIKESIQLLQTQQPSGGVVTVKVAAGRSTGQARVTLPNGTLYRGASSVAWCSSRDLATGGSPTCTIERAPDGSLVLVIEATTSSTASRAVGFNVNWLYAP